MATIFSENQLRVINSRNKNLLVSAAAGAGKTSVLVERILRRATDPENPVDIDKILVVTFTKAAAQEMKERIRQALEKELGEKPEDINLQRQATLIHNAQISTIDGFCLNIVRNNFHRIGLDPSFRIANEGEIRLIKKDALKLVLDEAYEAKDESFYDLVDRYTAKDKDTTLESSIMGIYEMAMSCPWPEKWLNDCKADYRYESFENFKDSGLLKKIRTLIQSQLQEAASCFEAALSVCDMAGGPVNYAGILENDISQVQFILSYLESDYEVLGSAIDSFAPKKLPAKSGGEKLLAEQAKNLRNSGKDILKGLSKSFFSQSLEKYYEELCEAGKSVASIVDLVLKFKKSFDEAKRERSIIDFSDMNHMAIDILIEEYEDMDHYKISEVAQEYRDFFAEIMTDEYQDSNQVQEIILAAISKEKEENFGNRFMVGDIKQSIYRFRLARPEIFNGKQIEYDGDGKKSEVIRLKDNYRSRQEVVDSVNAVFTTVMHRELGGVEYDENERLYAKASYPESDEDYTTLVYLEDKEGMKSSEAREAQAETLAYLIKQIKGTKKIYSRSQKEMVPADYGDIAILFRSMKEWRGPIKKAFDAAGIPYHMEGTGTFYAAKEISVLLNLLSVIDNPLNDIPMYGTMISYFGEMSEEEAATVRAEYSEDREYLWEMLKASAADGNEKAEKLVKFIEKYRKKVTYTTIGELISELITTTGYINYVTALSDGKQREANLELLIKKASEYAKTSFSGLFHFLRYIELIRKNEEDEGEANIFDENSATVRVMSIHKSKGLEFPVCIVGDIDSTFNTKDSSAAFLADVDEGIATAYINPDLRVKKKTLMQHYLSEKIKRDNAGEEIRIFYVAMTRAREQLILCGADAKASEYFDGSRPDKINSYLSMIKLMNSLGADGDYFRYIVTGEEERLSGEIEGAVNRRLIKERLLDETEDEEISGIAKRIIADVNREYSHKNLEKLYTKTTVSALKMAAMEEIQGETKQAFEERETSEYIPRFAGGLGKASGTDRGSAYHKLLQLIDFSEEISRDNWACQFEKMLEKELMDKAEQDLVLPDKIFRFGESELAKRMHEASLRGDLYKEQPFVMGVNADRLDKDFPDEEIILVQGVIDVFFVEDDRVVVMDYKTDRVNSKEELSDRYKTQIDIYAEALERITGKKVSEKLLYSFGLNDTIVIK